MKVAHIVRQYFPSVGGMEEVVRSLAVSQHQGGVIRPSVITLNRVFRDAEVELPSHQVMDGVPITRIPYRGSERYPLAPGVLRAIGDADLLHVHGIDFFYDFLAATRWLHRKPMVASTHGGFFHTAFASRLKQVYFRSVTRASSLAYRQLIATSEHDGSLFRDITQGERLQVIENGVDVNKFAGAAASPPRPTLIYFGRWAANKGLLEALALFAALRKQQPERGWTFLIAGRPYDLDGATLMRHAQTRGVADAIELIEGPSEDELRAAIGRASYFLCLSHHEGFGLAAVEAMSAGLTPILNDIPPFRRLIERSGRGLLVDRNAPQQAAASLVDFIDALSHEADPRLRTMESVAGYAWLGVEARYLDAYRRAAGTGPHSLAPGQL